MVGWVFCEFLGGLKWWVVSDEKGGRMGGWGLYLEVLDEVFFGLRRV